jgi:hypothetical protein
VVTVRAPSVLLLALAAGCGPSFTPRSVVADLRVLAIRASPLEVGPDDSVTLDAVRLAPPGGTIVDERWTFCPFSIGSTVAYACAVPACETALAPAGAASGDVSARVTLSPGALARQCVAQLSGSGALPPDVPGQLPEVVATIVRYVVRGSDGSSREAVQRLPLYPGGAPADRNLPPTISSVSIGGVEVDPSAGPDPTLASGATLEVRVVLTPESAQTYVDAGRTLTEQLVVSFYTTAGRFDYDWANGPDASVKLKGEELSSGTTEGRLWVVARDLRGGETVGGPYRILVSP